MTFDQWWAETKANFPAFTNELENSHLAESFKCVAHAAWIAGREDIFEEANKIRNSSREIGEV